MEFHVMDDTKAMLAMQLLLFDVNLAPDPQ